MDVSINDRKKEIEYLRMSLNMCELGVNYTQADLIIRVMEKLKQVKGDFNIEDGFTVFNAWKLDWEKYFEKNETK